MLIFLTLVSTLAFESDEPVQKLNGAYRQTKNKYGSMKTWKTRDSVTVIKVFRDGYWFGAFYDDKRQDDMMSGIWVLCRSTGHVVVRMNSKMVNMPRKLDFIPGILRRWATSSCSIIKSARSSMNSLAS
jgi:hypothetical protein